MNITPAPLISEMSPNIIQDLLAKSVEKLLRQQKFEENYLKTETSATRTDKPPNKSRTKVNVPRKQSMISSTNSPENLTLALVYNHLKEVAPGLAEQFGSQHKFQKMELKLEDVVHVFNQSKRAKHIVEKIDMKVKDSKSSEYKSHEVTSVRERFTPNEDEIIKAAIEEAGDEEVDYNALAKKLDRNRGSIYTRIELLKRTGGVKTAKRYFTLVEDYALIEALVIPRLQMEKLSEIKLLSHQAADLTKELKKGNTSVRDRWHHILQPWLLQHYSGTLNLRVERMLANYLVETFTDALSIDWPRVVPRPEFAGHTKNSLKHIFSNMKISSSLKFNLVSSDVTLQHIADYSELVYGEGAQGRVIGTSVDKLVRQKEVIAFFESKVEKMGIVDFF